MYDMLRFLDIYDDDDGEHPQMKHEDEFQFDWATSSRQIAILGVSSRTNYR